MITEAPFEQRWILQGRLCGQWAADLKTMWEETRTSRAGHRCVVDLDDVVCVDPVGEQTLVEMATEGARLLASRAYIKYILKNLHVAHT